MSRAHGYVLYVLWYLTLEGRSVSAALLGLPFSFPTVEADLQVSSLLLHTRSPTRNSPLNDA